MNDERSLVDDHTPDDEPQEPDALADVEDVEVRLDETDYDFGAMVAGARAARKRVRIRPNAHLLADLEALVEQAAAATSDDEAEQVEAEYERVKAQYEQTFPVVIEARSNDWLRQVAKDAKQDGINPDRKGLSPDERSVHTRRLLMRQIAGQIVHPTKGVTVDALEALYAASEQEADKLFRAVRAVNTQPSGESPDFSRAPSGTRRAG